MKNLLKGIGFVLASILVFTPIIVVGFILTIIKYCIFKGNKNIFVYIIDVIGGALYAIGEILKGLAKGYDILANALGGEAVEWTSTKEKNPKTLMGRGDATISAGYGDLRDKGLLNTKFGLWVDKQLDRFFNELTHGLYALRAYLEDKQLEEDKEPFGG